MSLLQASREPGTTAAVTTVTTEANTIREEEPVEIVTESIAIRTETTASPAATVLGNEP